MVKIALDFDGVLANSMEGWIARYNQLYGTKRIVSDIRRWDFYKDFNITYNQSIDIWKFVWENWRYVKPMEFGVFVIARNLANLGHVDIVTTVPESHTQYVTKWCMLFNIPFGNVIHIDDNKELLSYDYFIDDNPNMAGRMVAQPAKVLLLYDQPYNKIIPNSGNVIRIENLNQAYQYIYMQVDDKDKDDEDSQEPDTDKISNGEKDTSGSPMDLRSSRNVRVDE